MRSPRDVILFTAATANGARPAIMLCEFDIAFELRLVDLNAGEQRMPDFRAVNPLGSIPVVQYSMAGSSHSLAQSAAILLHLAELTGRGLPSDSACRALSLQWFFHACTDVAPTTAALFHLTHTVPFVCESNTDFFRRRLQRFTDQVEQRLWEAPYLGGPEVSIADICLFPTIAVWQDLALGSGERGHLTRWFETLAKRAGFARGMTLVGLSRLMKRGV